MALVAGGWNDALLVEEGDQSEYLKVIFNEIDALFLQLIQNVAFFGSKGKAWKQRSVLRLFILLRFMKCGFLVLLKKQCVDLIKNNL